MGRKILFVTTDQQRYDTLGCNGGTLSRTPVVDALASSGIRYERAHPQSVVCMPSRSTIITGQHPSTHGVWMNGVPLPADAPSVAELLQGAGYRTALVGKAHFEPFLDPFGRFAENGFAAAGTFGPARGFEHFESATHGALGPLHYARWITTEHPEAAGMFYPVLDGRLEVNDQGGGDTGAGVLGERQGRGRRGVGGDGECGGGGDHGEPGHGMILPWRLGAWFWGAASPSPASMDGSWAM